MAIPGASWYQVWKDKSGTLFFAGWIWATGYEVKSLGTQLTSCDIWGGHPRSSYVIKDFSGRPMHPVHGSHYKGPYQPVGPSAWYAIWHSHSTFLGWFYTSAAEARAFNVFLVSICLGKMGVQTYFVTDQNGRQLVVY